MGVLPTCTSRRPVDRCRNSMSVMYIFAMAFPEILQSMSMSAMSTPYTVNHLIIAGTI